MWRKYLQTHISICNYMKYFYLKIWLDHSFSPTECVNGQLNLLSKSPHNLYVMLCRYLTFSLRIKIFDHSGIVP